MSRTERLLDLIQLLRRHRAPVTGPALADELGISIRTLYRDIATLQAQGADIQGEPGLGYVLRPGFTLPPLMFSADEIEALVLGSRWVARRAEDPRLGDAAANALSKITAVLPAELRDNVDGSNLLVGGGEVIPAQVDLSTIRLAIREQKKLVIAYRNAGGTATERTIWPFAIGFFDRVRVVIGWCELRTDYRHFRLDRIDRMELLAERYPRRRAAMLKEWREREGIPVR
ncbi:MULTISPECIES: YafY family protein [unclassified Devosia]|uniref:helix-turn-helix transcriptional regulator n=1 Tax=unclassified Devosia TaxID=196773 RepID=UPI00086C0D20|nr:MULTISPECIES: YafY family protein [unclassified Devosia]MBN9361424.1 YafY family transcriptional regulator [Devosia sp.]ODS81098.1 MAG: DNA-binding protein [Devosia sp. SCN 66-27]OJX26497.1 MAG: transcriptional regulator [Devosia sp. 66-14]